MIERLYQVASGPALVPSWTNADGTQTIYLTSDPSVNEITLTIVNQLTSPLTLPPGEPVAVGSLPAGQSAVYLLFNGLIPNTAIDGASMIAPGWSKSASFTDPDTGFAYLAIAPTATTTFAVGAALTFTISGLAPTGQATSGDLEFYLAGAGLTDDQAAVPIYVNVTNPPKPGNQDLDLLVGFAERDEVFTGAASGPGNELLLYITNPGSTALVPGGYPAWGPSPPQFQIDLVCGSGQGALTDCADAGNISVDLNDDYGNRWKAVDQHKLGDTPYWQVQPDPAGPATVLGTGENATVVISLTNIVTTLPQGLTYLYLSYKDIPGYNDGFFAVEIVKVDPISVSLAAQPPEVSGANGPTQVTLQLEADNASYVTIPGTSYGKPTTGATFTDSLAVEIDGDTTFTLVAANYGTGQLASTSVDVGFVPAPLSVPAFAAGPQPVAPGQPVELTFTVVNATYVTIVGTAYQAHLAGGLFNDGVDLPEGLRTSTSFTLLAFNTNTGQIASASTEVQVTPDPIDAMIVGGLVNIDHNLQPAVSWSSVSCATSLMSNEQAGYQVDFAAGTFRGSANPTVHVIPWGIAGHCTTAMLIANQWDQGQGSLSFQVKFTQQMPAYLAGPTGFWFTVAQAY